MVFHPTDVTWMSVKLISQLIIIPFSICQLLASFSQNQFIHSSFVKEMIENYKWVEEIQIDEKIIQWSMWRIFISNFYFCSSFFVSFIFDFRFNIHTELINIIIQIEILPLHRKQRLQKIQMEKHFTIKLLKVSCFIFSRKNWGLKYFKISNT